MPTLASDRMRRREFIALLGGAAIAKPLMARAEQPGMPVIGFLSGRSSSGSAPFLAEFHRGLAEVGYVHGKNVTIEYRWAEGQYDRLPALAAELVARRVAVIVATGGNVAGFAAKAASSIIPIVFLSGLNPVEAGLVTSLNRPGGNVTGITLFVAELGAKRLEFLRELMPKAVTVAILADPNNLITTVEARDAQARAPALGLEVHIFNAATERDFEPALAAISAQRVEGLLVANGPFLIDLRDRLVRMVAERAVPTIYFAREFVEAGGLMSYGANIRDGYYRLGLYTGQILKGVQPADLPVQQPTTVELVVNLKTAKTLGIEVPPSLLARADEVIE